MNYSAEFQKALDGALKSEDPLALFKELIQKAISKKELARKVQGGFEISGRICSWTGLIPIIGSGASAVGAGADLVHNLAKKGETKNSWYLLGSRMSEVIIHSRIKNT